MSGLPTATIDVRDMLCAQALAVVAQAVERLAPGGVLHATYNTDDVQRDLAIWVRERGHRLLEMDATTLRLQRGPS